MKKFLSYLALAFSLAFSPIVAAQETYTLPRQVTHLLQGPYSSCSAVVIAPERAVTAAHCDGSVGTLNGKKVEVLRKVEADDLMILKVDGLECPCVPIGKSPEVLDSKMIAVGYPLGMHQVVSTGTYQGRFDSPELPEGKGFIVTTASAEGGFSGGGFFQVQEGKWKLVGVISIGSKTFTAGPGADKIDNLF